MKKDIRTSIAAGEALLFLENAFGSFSLGGFLDFLKSLGVNVYLILNTLLSEKLIAISESGEGVRIVSLTEAPNTSELHCV